MKELQMFTNNEFGELKVWEIDGKFFFPATVCAKILGYTNPRKAVIDHCKEDGVTKRDIIDNLGRKQVMKYISEGNLYRLITRSKLPSAERFEKWVFDEVLPTIRRTGGYDSQTGTLIQLTEQLTQTVAALMQAASSLAQTATKLSQTADKLSQAIDNLAIQENIPSTKQHVLETQDYYGSTRCKLETFPAEIKDQVDEMLEKMIQQQALNFSMISRYCTINGYTISQPSVKRYFQRRFSENYVARPHPAVYKCKRGIEVIQN